MDKGEKNKKPTTQETPKQSMTPEFLRGHSDGRGSNAQNELKGAEESALDSGAEETDEAMDAEQNPKGLFSGVGRKSFKGKSGKFKTLKMSLAGVVVFIIALFAMAIVALGTPIFTIGNIDFNLQDALGFTATSGILNKIAMHIIQKKLSQGEVPAKVAGELAAYGIEVGQVTATGDFVRTNTYVADIEKLKDLAVLGHFEAQPSEGELAVLYEGEVIRAEDYVATVESNLRLFAATEEAINISADFYYSEAVNNVLEDAGISRNNFYECNGTGDAKKDQECFNEVLEKMLDNNSELIVGSVVNDSDYRSSTISDQGDASSVIDDVAGNVDSTSKAAQLLNSAISANEPYLAASAFMAIEEPIQRARIEGGGPVNEVMNLLNAETEVEYTSIATGETETVKKAILTTPNFIAAVSKGKYSTSEAANFARDRALALAGADGGEIKDTVIDTDGQSESNIMIPTSSSGNADADLLSSLEDSVRIAMVEKNSELISSIVGGNRIVEGGSFLSDTINSRVLGAMASDESTIQGYHREVEEELARKAAAERATKSPFDISSPYTFMGSITYSLSNAMIRSRGTSSGSAGTMVGTFANLTGDSMKGIWNAAMADGNDDSYATTFGSDCSTAEQAAGAKGDLFCTPHTVISTGFMDWDEDDFNNHGIGEDELREMTLYAMDRMSTVGVRDAEVCNRWKEENGNPITSLGSFLSLYDACDGFWDDATELNRVATGAAYTFSSENPDKERAEMLGAYAAYDRVYHILDGSTSMVEQIRNEYLASHPKDNSRAGIIARRSGMTKKEAETALAYADYLIFIARYNPAERYAFGTKLIVDVPKEPLVDYTNKVAVDLYVLWHGRTEYEDVRNRVRIA